MTIFLFCSLPLRGATHTLPDNELATWNATNAIAARGDTFILPSDSAVWSSAFSMTKGLKLIGAGTNDTIIQRDGNLIAIAPDATALSSGEPFWVQGIQLQGGASALTLVTVTGAGASASKAFTNFVIQNCLFRTNSTTTSGNGTISIVGQVRGTIRSNVFDMVNLPLKNMGNDSTTEWENSAFNSFSYGSSDNLFFETNVIKFSASYSGADPGWIESGQGQRWVVRYNSWNLSNANPNELWDIHGFQNWPGGQTGTMISEFYGNVASNGDWYRWINHRGSWMIAFNNITTGTGAMDNEVNQYSCTSDVPGASGVYTCEVTNTYSFNNTFNGTEEVLQDGPVDNCTIGENVEYRNYNAACTSSGCSAGIGRGTTAPTGTCTTGVGFWVASTATPTADPTITQAGQFYKATATDTWTLYYTPFTFPNPVGLEAQAPTFVQSPSGLRVRGNR